MPTVRSRPYASSGMPTTMVVDSPGRRLRAFWRRRQWATIVFLAAVLVWSAVTLRLFVLPDLPPLPPTADAIVELGGPGERDDLAVALAAQGRSPYLAKSATSTEMHHGRCLPPVSGVTVLCFHSTPFTTRGEARSIAAMASQHGWHSVILVTTADQAWRAVVRVSRCFRGQIYVATASLPWHEWPYQIAYQWGATAKAFTYERSC
jgi:uncharacterized SAM-binding protein YcdF (DUF218 family)